VGDLGGGPPRVLADSGFRIYGGSWGTDGYIYLPSDGEDGVGLVRIHENGGALEPVTTLEDDESRHAWPQVLPSGQGLLFTVRSRAEESSSIRYYIAVQDLRSGEQEVLLPGVFARYASGYVLVVEDDGTLVAVPFDEEELTRGDPIPTSEELLFGVQAGPYSLADLAVSADGTIVYVKGRVQESTDTVVWVDRDGTEALSPGDDRLALSLLGEEIGWEIWVKELPDGGTTRVSFDEVFSERPVWSADGLSIAYTAATGTAAHIRRVRADGSQVGSYEVLLEGGGGVHEFVCGPEERGYLFREGNANLGLADLRFLDLETDSLHEDFLATEFNERAVTLSPDGSWMAYVSDITGWDQVYVRPFPDRLSNRKVVSTDGGIEPMWAHNGRELFYRDPEDGWLMAATFSTADGFTVEDRVRLFDATPYRRHAHWHGYDVARDDQRFVFWRRNTGDSELSLVLILNFFAELEERLGERD
jgi:hypothetical protein